MAFYDTVGEICWIEHTIIHTLNPIKDIKAILASFHAINESFEEKQHAFHLRFSKVVITHRTETRFNHMRVTVLRGEAKVLEIFDAPDEQLP